ncbi:MAG: type II secretion system protein [Sedimentisphaerales bacterium]|nr:type II secretion system protein [Sedimentisphaerales bacterium]
MTVVIAIIAMLMSILAPVMSKARRKARTMVAMSNKRQVAVSLNLFAMDNDDLYPQSVATVGFGRFWNWSYPTQLIGKQGRSPEVSRSVGEYLNTYMTKAETIYCPSAPSRYKHLQESWQAGDDWDNPDTGFPFDTVRGTYCLYWNYIGYLGDRPATFRGPRTPAGGANKSKLLVTDYFGYDNSSFPGAYSSCEKFKGAAPTPETWLLSSNWSAPADPNLPVPEVKLQAAYVDEHVETYTTSDALLMEASISDDGTVPYPPDGPRPGIFYLPPAAQQ